VNTVRNSTKLTLFAAVLTAMFGLGWMLGVIAGPIGQPLPRTSVPGVTVNH
jgi:hypothetical protein